MAARPTLKDVAARAGVSAGMAGRVLGNYGYYSDSTRRKVLAAAKAVRYTPNTVARSLRTRLTRTVGVLISDITTFFWSTLARGVQDRAAREGFGVILCNSDEESRSEKAYLASLVERSVDGLVISPTPGNHAYLRRLAGSRLPLVLVDRGIRGLEVPSVRVDNRQGAYEAVRHLIGLGHQRIAIIKGIDGVETSDQRYAGYAQALADHRIAVRAALVKEGRFLKDLAFQATRELLGMRGGPTAIFVCNEPMLTGCMLALKEGGVRIPQDMAVIGFDDPVWASYADPPLTAVSQPSYTMGILAFDLLAAQIGSPAASRSRVEEVVLKPALVIRKSCGAPAPGRGKESP
jgi:LacI family transcriptional regulator